MSDARVWQSPSPRGTGMVINRAMTARRVLDNLVVKISRQTDFAAEHDNFTKTSRRQFISKQKGEKRNGNGIVERPVY
jgi:hypothetical protein